MKKIVLFLTVLLVPLFIIATPVFAIDKVFTWDANSESDLAGYRLYQSDTSGSYTYGSGNEVAEILAGTETCTIDVADGILYWVLTAYDSNGNESEPSNEVITTIDQTAPVAPTNLQVQ